MGWAGGGAGDVGAGAAGLGGFPPSNADRPRPSAGLDIGPASVPNPLRSVKPGGEVLDPRISDPEKGWNHDEGWTRRTAERMETEPHEVVADATHPSKDGSACVSFVLRGSTGPPGAPYVDQGLALRDCERHPPGA